MRITICVFTCLSPLSLSFSQIALGTVSNIQEAVQWLRYTFLYVRMKQNPLVYGITHKAREVSNCNVWKTLVWNLKNCR